MTIAGFTFTKVLRIQIKNAWTMLWFHLWFHEKKISWKCHGSYRIDWTKKSIRVKLVSTFWLSSV